MIKTLYIVSALALINLFAAVTIANVSGNLIKKNTEVTPVTPEPLPTPIIVVKQVVKKVIKYAQASPTVSSNGPVASAQPANNQTPSQPAPTAATAPQPTGCIITLDGAKYDVTSFKNQHSGGDIFACGSDMSTSFWNKHGQSQFNKMQQFRI